MHIVKNQKSRYGDFDLIPAEGYTLLTAFTDLESGLLIAGEVRTDQREENPAQRPTGNLPIRYTIIDPVAGRMLTRNDLENIFSYQTQETTHPEHRLKSVVTRVHDAKTNSDHFENKLIDLDTGAIVSRSESVAFRSTPLPTLFESYLADKEAQQQRKVVEHGKYPPELYAQDLAGLRDGLLMHYRSRSENFELLREHGRYYLYRSLNSAAPAPPDKTLLQTFASPRDFWIMFASRKDWYLHFQPLHIDRVFARDLIYALNDLRKKRALDFDSKQHYQIYQWENKVYSKENQDVYTQFCVRCGAGVMYSPRYPRRICRDCCQLLTDRNGAPLDWQAVELGMRKSADGRVKVYIGEVVYWAQEARFGGIAVQQ